LLGCAAGTPVEIWFQDDARVGQQGIQGVTFKNGVEVIHAPAQHAA